jgi:hypothetical protein
MRSVLFWDIYNYFLDDEIISVRWAGHMAHMEENRTACRVLVMKHNGQRTFSRPMRKWENNIKKIS